MGGGDGNGCGGASFGGAGWIGAGWPGAKVCADRFRTTIRLIAVSGSRVHRFGYFIKIESLGVVAVTVFRLHPLWSD
jgi:hypothetical protein